jgi:fucose permease
VTIRSISPETAAQWISLFYLGLTLGRLLAGFLAIKLDDNKMVRLSYMVLAAGIALTFLPLGNTGHWVGFFLLGAGCAPIFPSLLHLTPTRFGRDHSQTLVGVQIASAFFGATISPALFGMLAGRVGFGCFPIFLGAVLILFVLLTENLNGKMTAEVRLR